MTLISFYSGVCYDQFPKTINALIWLALLNNPKPQGLHLLIQFLLSTKWSNFFLSEG